VPASAQTGDCRAHHLAGHRSTAPTSDGCDGAGKRLLNGSGRAFEDDLVAERFGQQRRVDGSGHSLRVRPSNDRQAPDGSDHGGEPPWGHHGDARPQIALAGVPPVMHDARRDGD
jgi:hypothetical protein